MTQPGEHILTPLAQDLQPMGKKLRNDWLGRIVGVMTCGLQCGRPEGVL